MPQPREGRRAGRAWGQGLCQDEGRALTAPSPALSTQPAGRGGEHRRREQGSRPPRLPSLLCAELAGKKVGIQPGRSSYLGSRGWPLCPTSQCGPAVLGALPLLSYPLMVRTLASNCSSGNPRPAPVCICVLTQTRSKSAPRTGSMSRNERLHALAQGSNRRDTERP